MANKVRIKIKLQSTESTYYYTTTQKKASEKLKRKKYDPNLRKVVLFEQKKI